MTGQTEGSGAYGLHLLGVGDRSDLLSPALEHWPALTVERRTGRPAELESYFSESEAQAVVQTDGVVHVDRSSLRAVFTTPGVVPDEALIHPYLAPVAAIAAVWLDRQSFHGGAFVAEGGVWGILGDRGAGKSTTLALLEREGYDIYCDDLIVTDVTTVFAGPRSIDLRTEAANELGAGEYLGLIGTRERWRLRLGPVASELPLRGWIHLGWADRFVSEAVAPFDRVETLGRQRTLNFIGPSHGPALLELAALPAWRVSRPHGLDSAVHSVRKLLELVHREGARR